MKCLKSVTTPHFKQKLIAPILGIINEILWILVAQGAAKRHNVKLGGQKKMSFLALSVTEFIWYKGGSIPSGEEFFVTSNFDHIQPLELQECMVSHLKFWFLFSKERSSTFKAFHIGSKLPYLSSTYVMVVHLNCTAL